MNEKQRQRVVVATWNRLIRDEREQGQKLMALLVKKETVSEEVVKPHQRKLAREISRAVIEAVTEAVERRPKKRQTRLPRTPEEVVAAYSTEEDIRGRAGMSPSDPVV